MRDDHSNDDLEALAQGAQAQLQRKTAGTAARETRGPGFRPPGGWVMWLAAGLLGVVALQGMGTVGAWFSGGRTAVTRVEAEQVLNAARAAVESHHRTTGRWPERIPLSALAALVLYEPSASGYRLAMWVDGARVSMDQSGVVQP